MGLLYKGKQHRNPSGLHNKVRFILREIQNSSLPKDDFDKLGIFCYENFKFYPLDTTVGKSWDLAYFICCYIIRGRKGIRKSENWVKVALHPYFHYWIKDERIKYLERNFDDNN